MFKFAFKGCGFGPHPFFYALTLRPHWHSLYNIGIMVYFALPFRPSK